MPRCARSESFTNRHLLRGVAFAIVFAAAIIYAPPLQSIFSTAALPPHDLLVLACFPLIVWGSDELWRWHQRKHAERSRNRPRARRKAVLLILFLGENLLDDLPSENIVLAGEASRIRSFHVFSGRGSEPCGSLTAQGVVHKRIPIRPNCQTTCASSLGTRMHPCDAGYAGTSGNSCSA